MILVPIKSLMGGKDNSPFLLFPRKRRLSAKELLLSNCGAREDSWTWTVPWTARRSNQSILKEITLNTHWKDRCWGWSSNNRATWCKQLTHWKRPWCWEKTLMLGKTEGRRRRGRQRMRWLDGIKTQCTWVWVNFRRWWRAGKPGMLQSMGLQRVRHDWTTEQQQPLHTC